MSLDPRNGGTRWRLQTSWSHQSADGLSTCQIRTRVPKMALCGRLPAAPSTGSGRDGIGREVPVDLGGALAAFADRPDDERLPAARISGREDAVRGRGVARRLHVGALVALDPQLVEQALLGTEEAHRQQDEPGVVLLLRARNEVEWRPARVLRPLDALEVPVAEERR